MQAATTHASSPWLSSLLQAAAHRADPGGGAGPDELKLVEMARPERARPWP